MIFGYACMATLESSWVRESIKAHKGKQDLLRGKFVWTDTFAKQGGAMESGRFANHSGLGKIIAYSYQ